MHGFIEDPHDYHVPASLLAWALGIAMLLVPLLGMLILLDAGIHVGEGFVAPEALGSPDGPPPSQPERDK